MVAVAPSVVVTRSGLLTTVQDLGRAGMGRYGVPTSGAMDPLAFRIANRLVGNPDNTPALEITCVGPQLCSIKRPAFRSQENLAQLERVARSLAILFEGRRKFWFGERRQGDRC